MAYDPSKCLGFPVDWGCVDQQWLDDLPEDVRERSERLAANTLRMLTGYQVGGCPTIFRPCGKTCSLPLYTAWPTVGTTDPGLGAGSILNPRLEHGTWTNSCGCNSGCGCPSAPEVLLTPPVGHVVEVLINGAALDPGAYRVDDGFRLVRTDGQGWPACQDMRAAFDAEGAFSVLYTAGVAVDEMGAFAAGKLAEQFASACLSSGKCSLPPSVRRIARQGVTYEIAAGAFPDGFTGIREVDLYIQMHNPHRLKSPPRIFAIDGRAGRNTTWLAAPSGP